MIKLPVSVLEIAGFVALAMGAMNRMTSQSGGPATRAFDLACIFGGAALAAFGWWRRTKRQPRDD